MRSEGLRSAELSAALARAVEGDRAALFRQLEVQSGLPGPRANMNLARGLASECARLGPEAGALAYAMATMTPDEAPGATSKEFLVVCGVLAVGARAAVAEERAAQEDALALLEARADDPRFRVRDAVPVALALLGARMKDELAERLDPWMDRYFQAAAVLRALTEPAWLETFQAGAGGAPLALLHRAFALANGAPRSASRYPGHKALVDALGSVPKALAKRVGITVFDALHAWAEQVDTPEMREVIVANLSDPRFKRPFGAEIERIEATLEARKPPPRDPTLIRHGTRGRGKRRGRR